jgi:hypothetical protein
VASRRLLQALQQFVRHAHVAISNTHVHSSG